MNHRDILDPNKIDPDTGLPQLPEGDRWFVALSWPHRDEVRVEWQTPLTSKMAIKSKNWWTAPVTTEKVTWRGIRSGDRTLDGAGLSKPAILRAAQTAIEQNNKINRDRRLLGAYPPHNLQEENS